MHTRGCRYFNAILRLREASLLILLLSQTGMTEIMSVRSKTGRPENFVTTQTVPPKQSVVIIAAIVGAVVSLVVIVAGAVACFGLHKYYKWRTMRAAVRRANKVTPTSDDVSTSTISSSANSSDEVTKGLSSSWRQRDVERSLKRSGGGILATIEQISSDESTPTHSYSPMNIPHGSIDDKRRSRRGRTRPETSTDAGDRRTKNRQPSAYFAHVSPAVSDVQVCGPPTRQAPVLATVAKSGGSSSKYETFDNDHLTGRKGRPTSKKKMAVVPAIPMPASSSVTSVLWQPQPISPNGPPLSHRRQHKKPKPKVVCKSERDDSVRSLGSVSSPIESSFRESTHNSDASSGSRKRREAKLLAASAAAVPTTTTVVSQRVYRDLPTSQLLNEEPTSSAVTSTVTTSADSGKDASPHQAHDHTPQKATGPSVVREGVDTHPQATPLATAGQSATSFGSTFLPFNSSRSRYTTSVSRGKCSPDNGDMTYSPT